MLQTQVASLFDSHHAYKFQTYKKTVLQANFSILLRKFNVLKNKICIFVKVYLAKPFLLGTLQKFIYAKILMHNHSRRSTQNLKISYIFGLVKVCQSRFWI